MATKEKAQITKQQIEELRKDYASVVSAADIHQLAQLVMDAGKLVDKFRIDLGSVVAACPCESVCTCKKECTNECNSQCTCNGVCNCESKCPCQDVNKSGWYEEDDWSRIQIVAKGYTARLAR